MMSNVFSKGFAKPLQSIANKMASLNRLLNTMFCRNMAQSILDHIITYCYIVTRKPSVTFSIPLFRKLTPKKKTMKTSVLILLFGNSETSNLIRLCYPKRMALVAISLDICKVLSACQIFIGIQQLGAKLGIQTTMAKHSLRLLRLCIIISHHYQPKNTLTLLYYLTKKSCECPKAMQLTLNYTDNSRTSELCRTMSLLAYLQNLNDPK